jgi:hypothetical protein
MPSDGLGPFPPVSNPLKSGRLNQARIRSAAEVKKCLTKKSKYREEAKEDTCEAGEAGKSEGAEEAGPADE